MNKDYVAAAKDALVLIIITLIAGLCLGGVYELTKEDTFYNAEEALEFGLCTEIIRKEANNYA